MEEADEVAEESRKINWKRYFMFSIPIVVCVIAAVVAFSILVMPKPAVGTKNQNSTFIDNTGNNLASETEAELKQRHAVGNEKNLVLVSFNIEFVELKLNFTDAELFCNRKNSNLVVLFNEPEEEYFLQAINDNGDFLDNCHNSGFIGYRMILDEELAVDGTPMTTFTGELNRLASLWLDNHFDPNKECIVLIYHPTSKKFGVKSESCMFDASCYLCETTQGCSKDFPFCYLWRYTINHTQTYSAANKYCTEKKNGRLARIRNEHMLETMLRQMYIKSGKLFTLYTQEACRKGYYISKLQMDQGPLGFERIDENQINYISHTIKLDNQPFGAHCLGVVRNNRDEISFSPVRCDKEMCFFCRSERSNTNT